MNALFLKAQLALMSVDTPLCSKRNYLYERGLFKFFLNSTKLAMSYYVVQSCIAIFSLYPLTSAIITTRECG